MKRKLQIALSFIGLAIIAVMVWPDLFPEKWQFAATLPAGRMEHSAALLSDGRVLVAGGYGPHGCTSVCELFDPQKNRWTPTGSMLNPRTDFTATLLKDGQVLVAGGQNDVSLLDKCEIFDPSKGTWRATRPMNHGNRNHLSTLLSNGKVLVVTNEYGSSAANSTELFDPTTEKWSKCDSDLGGVWYNPTLYPDGTIVLYDGGISKIFNEHTEKWETGLPASHLTNPFQDLRRYGFGQILLPDGKYLIIGGADDFHNSFIWYHARFSNCRDFFTDCTIFDPNSGKWKRTISLQVARNNHTATLLEDGRVLVVGGHESDKSPDPKGNNRPVPLSSCEIISVKELEQ